MDSLVLSWAIWAVCSAVFHEKLAEALVFRLGMAYNVLGLYFLSRVFIYQPEDLLGICQTVILALVPVALEMLNEAWTGRNLFSVFGGVGEFSELRAGRIRAQGPFSHSILAGTVGAICMPMAILLWRQSRKVALLGLIATGSMVFCSRSSGPIMTVVACLSAMALWPLRHHMRFVRWTVVIGILGLALVMKAPVYYLLDRIDLTGNSTGWHRAVLIEGAMTHLSRWWLGGTDFTRDWTPEGGFDENSTDITNHYIRSGVSGGLPLLVLFLGVIIAAFIALGRILQWRDDLPLQYQFMIWTLGSILFGHVVTMVSVTYYDQSILFLYLALAAIASFRATFRSYEFGTDTAPMECGLVQGAYQ